MRTLERRAEAVGISPDVLMENAGLEVAKLIRNQLATTMGANILVLVGKGNNGGDGLVVARRLCSWGGRVTVCLVAARPENDLKLLAVLEQGTQLIHPYQDGRSRDVEKILASCEIVVDAILGTGCSRPVEGAVKTVLGAVSREKTRRPKLRIVSIDLPSGVNPDTGKADPNCLKADITVSLGRPKIGLYKFPGASLAGQIETVDIGLPDNIDSDFNIGLLTPALAGSKLPYRPLSGHKGTFGRLMIVAGSSNYVGAASLAANAAARVGVGLVTLAIPKSLQSSVSPRAAEATYLPLDETVNGSPSPKAAGQILEVLETYDALLVGCGIGMSEDNQSMLNGLLLSGNSLPPTVVDADGLNFLATKENWWQYLTTPTITTPHPGEMSRLTGISTPKIGEDRVSVALNAAKQWDQIVVLKGAFTIIANGHGQASISPFANPALASAGTGDVLAGTIAGLLGQGLNPYEAGQLGVYLHGLAATIVSQELGDSGMLASDLLPALPKATMSLAKFRI